MKVKSLLVVLLVGTAVVFAGCQGDKQCKKSACSPCEKQMNKVSQSYPAPKPCGKEVRLDKSIPCEVAANQPFDYKIKVTNLTDRQLANVVVTDRLSGNVNFKSSQPQVEKMPSGESRWVVGDLGPHESKTISATAVAEGKGTITSCAAAAYDFVAPTSCAKINIVESRLKIVKCAPENALSCDRIPVSYLITNTGDAAACNVSVKDNLQPGLTGPNGRSEVSFSYPSIAPGKSMEYKTTLNATKSGRYASKAVATSNGSSAESNMTETNVSSPALAITESGPEMQYIGRSVTYQITVTNKGDGIARDTMVQADIPDEFRFNEATMGGTYSHASPGKVVWNVGTIEPGTSKTVTMTLSGEQAGTLTTKATAKAYCADAVTASTATNFKGVAGVLLQMVDVYDPIEVGQSETYMITVTNQGSISDSNISLTCMMDEGMQYVSSSGPTEAKVEGNTITFGPLSTLAPKAEAKWQVVIKAAAPGNERFKVSMTTDQIGTTKPAEKVEATTFYK